MRKKYLYRVTAEVPSGWDGKTYLHTRHFQSRGAAKRHAERLRDGVDYPPVDWNDEGFRRLPAMWVKIERSQPITFD